MSCNVEVAIGGAGDMVRVSEVQKCGCEVSLSSSLTVAVMNVVYS